MSEVGMRGWFCQWRLCRGVTGYRALKEGSEAVWVRTG